MQETTRTSEGLRSTLFDTLDRFMRGEIDHVTAKTTAKLADSIIKSVAVDLEYKRTMRALELDTGKPIPAMRLNIAMTEQAFEDVNGSGIVVRGKDPAGTFRYDVVKKPRLRSVLVVGLIPTQSGIIQSEFANTFNIECCTADDIRIIEGKAPTYFVLLMTGFISHKVLELVKSLTSEFECIKGGITALRDELTKMHKDIPE